MNRLFIFNPDCELAIANGNRYFTPSSNVVQMTVDLSLLPLWLGGEGDYVLTQHSPDKVFLKEVILPLSPACQAVTENQLTDLSGLKGEPWGWSPKICHWLTERGIGPEWQTEWKERYSRKVAREGLLKLMEELPFLSPEIIPQICYSLSDLGEKVKGGEWLVKAPWSSSGKGILVLKNQVGDKEKEWLNGMFRRQGYLMLEKKLNRFVDFAMEFYAGNQEIEFIGWSHFTTGIKGEYRGNYIGPQENITRLLTGYLEKEVVEELKRVMPLILSRLIPSYRGYLGVDMMVYKDEKGKMRLQPCVEINLRYNMGIVALCLSRNFLADNVVGEYTITFYPGKGDALVNHRHMKQTSPVVYKNNRIKSGYLNLTPVTEATHFLASVHCY